MLSIYISYKTIKINAKNLTPIEFDDSNKIIFGFNGIGKTSIYNYLKANGYNVQAFKCNIKNIDTIEIPFITLINKKPFPILIIIEEISEKNLLFYDVEYHSLKYSQQKPLLLSYFYLRRSTLHLL